MAEKVSKGILEAIRDKNLAKLARSERARDAARRADDAWLAETKAILKGEVTVDPRTYAASDFARMYYSRVAYFYGKPCMVDFTRMNKRAIAFWYRVYLHCQKHNVDPETFMAAQFTYFSTTFSTVPKLQHLLTEKSIARAREVTPTAGRNVSFAQDANLDTTSLLSRCDKQVRDMCRAQKVDRLEFYKRFVLTGAVSLPFYFLDADPVYKKALNV